MGKQPRVAYYFAAGLTHAVLAISYFFQRGAGVRKCDRVPLCTCDQRIRINFCGSPFGVALCGDRGVSGVFDLQRRTEIDPELELTRQK